MYDQRPDLIEEAGRLCCPTLNPIHNHITQSCSKLDASRKARIYITSKSMAL